ncbi:protein FAM183A-like [Aricia agestis]|uniref:protein FAM183A-like n=1 Tax=Aricia agestis TaxID=91739 RepID=UPI001C203036|nr:protein FAM183A-like [Aricia agestis]XP_041972275.1 protein FAM183A-like [Aricia agestis]XP_041972339.1 protein FAM183A-like [Aricia agestis]XP_041972410.1 protein FAM183A-like [Aricia agestis]XP_041972485.1 protein FAM183A-like [Aricia agestis]
MGDKKCTFGVRMAIDISMLNEIIYREVKHFRNYKIYRPNFGAIPVAGKIAAAHDQLKTESQQEADKVEEYFHNVAQTRAEGPKTKFPEPATENQIYGWYEKPLMALDRGDRRLYKPRRESKDTKIDIVILVSNPRRRH